MKAGLVEYIKEVLEAYLQTSLRIAGVQPVHGGDINQAFKLQTTAGDFFVKYNSARKYSGMFEQEAIGLGALAATETIRIPQVIAFDEVEADAFLLLEWIEQGSPSSNFWEDFGHGLACLHQTTLNRFGWAQDNYIGSLVQSNQWTASWSEFFALQRLIPQVKLAVDQGSLSPNHARLFDKLFHRLENLFPKEPPALLHGDLWSGNFMVTANGSPVIMDPAVYYGHREMDLAMTKLFGGFHEQLYHSYQEVFPLEKGWEERVALCNLYPLMVHVNLFGGGYVGQVETALRKFI